jgi:SAM-dependent methyltransferase
LSISSNNRPDLEIERRFVHHYTASQLPNRAAEVEAFVDFIRPQPRDCALDVASGPATIARVLVRRVKRVIALDKLDLMLLEAARHEVLPANLFLACGAAEQLPFGDAAFDVLTCAYTLANIRELPRLLRECARVLTPSGRMAFMDVIAPEDPAKCEYLNRLESMRGDCFTRIRRASELLEAFQEAGLPLEDSHYSAGCRQRMGDWLRLSPAAEDHARSRVLQQMLLDSIEGDKAGLHPLRQSDDLEFHHQTAWFLLRR